MAGFGFSKARLRRRCCLAVVRFFSEAEPCVSFLDAARPVTICPLISGLFFWAPKSCTRVTVMHKCRAYVALRKSRRPLGVAFSLIFGFDHFLNGLIQRLTNRMMSNRSAPRRCRYYLKRIALACVTLHCTCLWCFRYFALHLLVVL